MAAVRIWRFETRDRLPPVCMRCGAAAEVYKRQTFAWYPWWVNVIILAGVLPWLVVAVLVRKSMRVEVPLCGRHAGHWWKRYAAIWLGLAGLFGLAVATVVLRERGLIGADVNGYLWAAVFVGGCVWLFGSLVLVMTAIGPDEITDESIRLVRVSAAFRDTLKATRQERLPVARPVGPPPGYVPPRPKDNPLGW